MGLLQNRIPKKEHFSPTPTWIINLTTCQCSTGTYHPSLEMLSPKAQSKYSNGSGYAIGEVPGEIPNQPKGLLCSRLQKCHKNQFLLVIWHHYYYASCCLIVSFLITPDSFNYLRCPSSNFTFFPYSSPHYTFILLLKYFYTLIPVRKLSFPVINQPFL